MGVFRRLCTYLTLIAALAFPVMAAAQPEDAVQRALAWLASQQLPDGGFSNGFSEGSDIGTTADAIVAVLSGGGDPSGWTVDGRSPLDFLVNQASSVHSPGGAAKVALAAEAAGLDPRSFGGVDLIAMVSDGFDPATGYFGGGPFDSALCIFALSGAGIPLPQGALDGLLAGRLEDGSYSFNGDRTPGAGDSNTTALAVQALMAAGARDQVGPSLEYFRAVRNEDGGWTYQKPSAYGEATDANSTALVAQALLAAGEDLASWGNPLQTLASLQVPSGAFIYNAATSAENALATIQAIPALVGVDYSDVATLSAARPAGETARSPGAETLLAGVVVGVLVVLLTAAAWMARRRS
jgi:hypothetical protein